MPPTAPAHSRRPGAELPVAFVADGKGTVRWVGGPEQGEEALRDAVEWVASGR